MIPKLLFVEDDPSLPNLVDFWIKTHAFSKIEVVRAGTLATARELAPMAAVIVLDLKLPDSHEHLSTLEAIPQLSLHAPVIVLTGFEDPVEPYNQSLLGIAVSDYGADSCLFKSMIFQKGMEGIDLLMFFVQSAAHRRAFQNKSKNL